MANEDYSNTDLLNRKNAMLDMVNRLQQTFLSETTSNEVFENALKMLLDITESEYGFIGEVLQNSEGQPFLKTKSITNIAWNEATRKFYEEKAPKGLEFTNLNTLFGVVLKTGRAIIANEPSTHPQRGGLPEGHPPLNAFLGLPLLVGTKMVGMAGVSNRLGGYDENLIAEIEPITTTLGRLIEAQQGKLALQESETRLLLAVKELQQKNRDLERTTTLLNDAQRISNMGAWELDLSTGKTFWTDEVYAIHEVEKDFDHNKLNGIEFYHTNYRPIISKAIAETIAKRIPFDVKCQFITAKRNHRWVRVSGYPVISDEKVTHLIGMFQDITKQEADREALQESESKLKEILNAINDGIWSVSLPDRKILYLSPSIESIYGYSTEELIEKPSLWQESIHPDDVFALEDTIQELTANDSSISIKRIIRKDGAVIWVQDKSFLIYENGKPIKVVGVISDITDSKRKQEEITTIRKEVEDITNAVNESSLVSIADINGNIVKTNQRYRDLTGYSEAELLGQNHRIFNSGYHNKSFWKSMWQTISSGTIWRGEVKNKAKDGSEHWVSTMIHPIKNTEGVITNYLSIRQDITGRKQAEKELQESEARYRGYIDNAPDGVFIVDATGQYTEVNDAGCAMTGYSKEEILTMSISDFLFEESFREGMNHFTRLLEIGKSAGELPFRHKDGSKRWWSLTTARLNSDRFIGFAKDITDRRQAEEELIKAKEKAEKNEEKYRILFNANKDGISLLSIGIDGKPSGFIDFNDAVCEAFGFARDELMHRRLEELEVPVPDNVMIKRLETLRTKGIIEFETIIKNQTGDYRNLDVKAVLINYYNQPALMNITRDITDRKRAELALKQFNDIAENIQLGIYVYHLENIKDDRTLRLTYANPATEKMTGIKTQNIIGKTLDENFPALRALNIPQRYAEVVRTQEQKNFEDVYYDDDRISQSFFSVKAFPLPNNYLGIAFENITESKLIAESLVIAKEEAENANKAKSEFLANMSHEIRTPLNAVIGFTELLKNTPLSPVQQQYVDIANVSGHTLLGVINGILDFSKIEAGMLKLEMIKVDLIELAEHSVEIVKYSAIKKNLKVHLDIDPSIPRFCITDPFRLRQVITNLLSNAVKFTHKGEVEFKIKFATMPNGLGKFHFSIRDTGIGIKEEQKNKLFKAFSQADSSTTRKFGGTGLGLVISEMIVNRLGSKINIESTHGEGSTFWFEFVTITEEGERLQITSPIENRICSETSFPNKEFSILIVEDDPINVILLEAMLRKIVPSAKYTEATTGLEGLEKYKQSQPDIVFMDMQMPEMGGLEATCEIRKLEQISSKHVPIIAFTAGAFKADEEKCLSAGMNYFLTKPAKLENITFVIRKYLFLDETPDIAQCH